MSNAREKRLTVIAAAVCVVMLALIAVRLYGMLRAPSRAELADSSPFADDMSADGLPGVVLIDIGNAEGASGFHVSVAGVYVLAVDESSGAYLAGVRSGDRVVSVNGVAVATADELRDAAFPDGLTLLLSRSGRELTVTLGTGSQL